MSDCLVTTGNTTRGPGACQGPALLGYQVAGADCSAGILEMGQQHWAILELGTVVSSACRVAS